MFPPPIEKIFMAEFGSELIYSFVIIVCSLMIYFGTKQLEELSSHKGIHYFRRAFLFFAIAYSFRSVIKFIITFFNIRTIYDLSPSFFGPAGGQITLFLFMYFSSIAVFYLLYSVMWKKWKDSNKMYLFHFVAVTISLMSILSRSKTILLLVNLFLLIVISIVFYLVHKESKRKRNVLHTVYMLLFMFWFLNVLDVLVPSFLQELQLFISMISISIFLAMLYKVLKKAGN